MQSSRHVRQVGGSQYVSVAAGEDSLAGRLERALRALFGPRETRYELGVLFVHGMGEQARGDTLTEAGDALVQWLERWCERPPHGTTLGKGTVAVVDSSLRTAHDDELTTAHMTLRLTLPLAEGDPSGHREKVVNWVVAESWWAEGFRPASFNQLVAWVLGIGPWVLATQFHGIRDRVNVPPDSPGLLRWLLWPVAVLTIAALVAAAVLTSLLLTLVALLVLLLRLVPIGPVQSFAGGIQRSLASSFGDLMVLVQSPTRFAAMRSQVRDDVQALVRQCEKVVVIAHSQGSHIAWEAIREADPGRDRLPSNLVRFVTYGQAMRKLKLAYEVSKHELDGRVGLVAAAAMGAQLGLAALLVAGISAMLDGGAMVGRVGAWFTGVFSVDGSFLLVAPVALIAAGNAVLLYRGRIEMDEVERKLARDVGIATRARETFRWTDMWASADPAPNGPLSSRQIAQVESWRIRNTGSIVMDHSIYWQNVTEFIGAIARELGRLGAETRHFPGEDAPFPSRQLRSAALTRGARVQVLIALRIMWLGAALAFGIKNFAAIRVAINPDWLPKDIPVISAWLPTIVALGIIAIVALIGWVGVAKVWGAGVRADDRSYFAGTARGPFPWPSWGALFLLAAIPIAATFWLWRSGEDLLAMTYAVAIPPVVLALTTFVSGGGRGFADEKPAQRLRLTGAPLILAALVIAAIVLSIFVGWLRPTEDASGTRPILIAAYAVMIVPLAWATFHRFRRFLRDHRSLRREAA